MDVIIDALLDYVIYAFMAVLIYAFVAITRALTKELKAKAELIKNENQRNLVFNAFDKIDLLTGAAVRAMESVTAKDLRKLVKDGKMDRQALAFLSKEVLSKIKSNLEPEMIDLLNIPDIDGYIKDVIEVQLEAVKKEYAD